MTKKCAVVIGVGARQGVGAAVAVKAATEGMHVFIAGRTEQRLQQLADEIQSSGGKATVVVTDSTQEGDLKNLFLQASKAGEIRLVVYNTGRNLPAPLMESDTRLIEDHWRRCVLGAFITGQLAVEHMLDLEGDHKGTILYTGASASLRGKPLFAAFASAKAAQRAMAQSMAREFGPQGIHVGHIVIDGLVDGALVRRAGPLGKLYLRNKGEDGALHPDEVAKTFWMLHSQQRSAWTHELEVRPFKESF